MLIQSASVLPPLKSMNKRYYPVVVYLFLYGWLYMLLGSVRFCCKLIPYVSLPGLYFFPYIPSVLRFCMRVISKSMNTCIFGLFGRCLASTTVKSTSFHIFPLASTFSLSHGLVSWFAQIIHKTSALDEVLLNWGFHEGLLFLLWTSFSWIRSACRWLQLPQANSYPTVGPSLYLGIAVFFSFFGGSLQRLVPTAVFFCLFLGIIFAVFFCLVDFQSSST